MCGNECKKMSILLRLCMRYFLWKEHFNLNLLSPDEIRQEFDVFHIKPWKAYQRPLYSQRVFSFWEKYNNRLYSLISWIIKYNKTLNRYCPCKPWYTLRNAVWRKFFYILCLIWISLGKFFHHRNILLGIWKNGWRDFPWFLLKKNYNSCAKIGVCIFFYRKKKMMFVIGKGGKSILFS